MGKGAKPNPRRFRLRVEDFDGQHGRTLYFAERDAVFTAFGTEMRAGGEKGVRLQVFEARTRLAFCRWRVGVIHIHAGEVPRG